MFRNCMGLSKLHKTAVRSAKRAGMIVYGVLEKYSEHNMEEIKKIADGYLINFHSAPSPTPVVRKVV